MYCGKLTDIVVINAPWKTYYHRVNCGKLTITVCTVENLLTSCVVWKTYCIVYCGKLAVTVYRQQTFDIVCTVENLQSPCVLWQTYGHRVYREKLTDIVVFNAPWKTY